MQTENTLLAWHFVADTLRDGSPVPADGVKLTHAGKVIPCQQGLHASVDPFDALPYAPGNTLCRVLLSGEIVHHGGDKVVASERTILKRIDFESFLRQFARQQALKVIHLWDAPDFVRQYLETGDESIRCAAWDAARDAALDAAWDAARDAAWAAARAAAWDAARAAARGAARDAARDAARAAAWDAARSDFNKIVNDAFAE